MLNSGKKKTVLFFCKGSVPTAEDEAAYNEMLQYKVLWRNAKFYKPIDKAIGEKLEPCDFVAGCYPDDYEGKECIYTPKAKPVKQVKKETTADADGFK